MHGAPSPILTNPIPGVPRVQYLRTLVRSASIDVGDYSYYDDPKDPSAFERFCVLYH